MVAAFGWSAGDVFKLIEVSVVVYQAFNNARKNSSRQFQLLTDEFGRFKTFLELLHNLLDEHNQKLYFGHDQFKATLEECQEFLLKYSVLGERRNSVVKFFRTIEWTTEEKGTINRLVTAVHGHAHVIGLYIGYMTLKTSLEERAVNEKIVENTQETLHELRRLRRQPSIPIMPFITEEPGWSVAQDLGDDFAQDTAASKLEQVAKELDGFSQFLKRERDSWLSQHRNKEAAVGLEDTAGDEAASVDIDVTLLQTVLQEVEHKVERARYGSKREQNQNFVRLASRRDTHDSGISDMSNSTKSTQNSLLPTSPMISANPSVYAYLPSSIGRMEDTSPILESRQAPLLRQISMSPITSPFLGSSSTTTSAGTGTDTAATTPMFTSPTWNPDTGTRPPSLRLPPAAADWSLFCNDAQVICEGWQRPWSCKISQRRRTRDCGLSFRAERADGSCLYHDVPPLGIAVPHTLHTGANPHAKNTVTFIDLQGHKLKKVTVGEEEQEMKPKYIFRGAADHKAFQELIYGCYLEESWDVTSIESNREKESVTQTLRLWRDTHTRIPMILFYTNNRKRSSKAYIQEPKTSFTDKWKVEKKKPTLQMNFSDQRLDNRIERATSVSSGGSSVRSHPSSWTSAHIQWITIEFASLPDRDKFLSLWQG